MQCIFLQLIAQEMNADRSTTQTVISSCLDRRARPGGNDMRACRLEMFRARRTLLRTLRTITSATVEFRREPKGVARRVVARASLRRFEALAPGVGDMVSRFLVVTVASLLLEVAIAISATVAPSFEASAGTSPCWEPTLCSSPIALFVAVFFF